LRYLENKTILFLSNQSYEDRYWTSKQYITQQLIQRNEVLYVDGNYSFGKMVLSLLGKPWIFTLFGRLRKEKDNLWVFTPPPRLPLRNHFRFFSVLHQFILRKSLQRVVRKLNLQVDVFWTFIHTSARLVGHFGENLAIYHCVDDWELLMPTVNMGRPARINADEKALCEKVDLTFCTARSLEQKMALYTPSVFYTPNAADFNFFSQAREAATPVPNDIATLKSPVIGYIGTIAELLELDMLYDVFKEHPEWQLVFIGIAPSNTAMTKISTLENVHILGLKPRTTIPGYLKKIDVTIIPFLQRDIEASISPLKLFEYFAAGKPVVSTALPEIAIHDDVVYLHSNKSEFISGIKKSLERLNDSDFHEKITAKAKENSWQARIILYNKYIHQILSTRERNGKKEQSETCKKT
jgi:glycosyltransferase involved in cell wall biosynthesis